MRSFDWRLPISPMASTSICATPTRSHWRTTTLSCEPFLTVREAIALGILLGIAGQLGDLVESLLKRDADVKDASHTIPGHGGVLDRFDSLIFAAPLSYYFLRMVVLRS